MALTGLVVTADGIDVTCHTLAPLNVTWGRTAPGESLEPRRLTATFEPEAKIRRGTELRVAADAPHTNPKWNTTVGTWAAQTGTWKARAVALVLFAGEVSDTSTQWGGLGDEWVGLTDVVATDPIADLAHLPVGDAPWPVESVSARATRIQALTPLVWQSDASTARVAARDVDAQPALDLLDDLAVWASLSGGLFYDPSLGVARFLLDTYRQTTAPGLILDACQLTDDANAVESVADLVNDVTVTYRDAVDPNAQPSARYTSPSSIDRFGRRAVTYSTELVDAVDANNRAQAAAIRLGLSLAKWVNLTTSSSLTEDAEAIAETLFGAWPGLRTKLVNLPPPAAPSWSGYLEGWSLEVDVDASTRALVWTADVQLSPATWSGPLTTWADHADGTRWVDVDPAQPWIAALADLWPAP